MITYDEWREYQAWEKILARVDDMPADQLTTWLCWVDAVTNLSTYIVDTDAICGVAAHF